MNSSSFIYPRTIRISRPIPLTGVGTKPYQYVSPQQENILFTGISASIQAQSSTGLEADLPANAKGAPVWRVFIPFWSLTLGQINNRDIVTDDLGNRYQVATNYWNSLGYNLECELLLT